MLTEQATNEQKVGTCPICGGDLTVHESYRRPGWFYVVCGDNPPNLRGGSAHRTEQEALAAYMLICDLWKPVLALRSKIAKLSRSMSEYETGPRRVKLNALTKELEELRNKIRPQVRALYDEEFKEERR